MTKHLVGQKTMENNYTKMKKCLKLIVPETAIKLARAILNLPLKIRTSLRLTRAERHKLHSFRMTAFPETPITAYAIGKIADVLSIKIEGFSPWKQYDLVLAFQDNTHTEVDVDSYLKKAYDYTHRTPPSRVLNANIQDISKKRLGKVFGDVFGYPLEVDPTCYSGAVVRKSDANAKHDGVVINCPIDASDVDAASSYTVLINNERHGDMVEDMRVVWIGSLMDFFYLKRRPLADRFSNDNTFVTMEETTAYVSIEEQAQIVTFAHCMGLDYGEMDCLRDLNTGRLYICDINKTPAGPPNGLSKRDVQVAIQRMALQFVREFVCVPAKR